MKSKGRLKKLAKNPAIALAARVCVCGDQEVRVLSRAFASEKNASWPRLRAIARATVGVAPAHSPVTPSDFTMDVIASTTDL